VGRGVARRSGRRATTGAERAAAAGRRVLAPKPLPNNWLLGQVAGVAVDKRDHVWIVQRPRSLSDRELGAAQNPPLGNGCIAGPPVLAFDQSGNLVRAWGGPARATSGPIASTASSSTRRIPYGSPATAGLKRV
jgi:hypothetical protein